jgi:signal transduction histidine kinase
MAALPIENGHPAFEGIQSSREMLNKVILDMSDLTKSLHTDRITEIGLTEAIRFDLETLRKSGLVKIDFSAIGDQVHFGEQKSIFLFRMYQEMMNNVLKHSKATHVGVSVTHSGDNKFILKVEDNGVGFDAAKKKTQATSSSGIGLKSMTNRARLIGAEISIQSRPENGTIIIVELPLEPVSS